MNKVCYDPAYHSLLYHALDLIFVPQLTSYCDLDSDIDEIAKHQEVDRLEAQYLLASTLLYLLVQGCARQVQRRQTTKVSNAGIGNIRHLT